jgi:hypothetical protein
MSSDGRWNNLTSLLQKRRTKQAGEVQAAIVGLLLLLNTAGLINLTSFFSQMILYWAGVNLVGGFLWVKAGVVTPEIMSPKCYNCQTPMVTALLSCPNCGSSFNFPKKN